jgi:hypothetical protein
MNPFRGEAAEGTHQMKTHINAQRTLARQKFFCDSLGSYGEGNDTMARATRLRVKF